MALKSEKEPFRADGNPGNSIALIKLIINYDALLKRHIESLVLRNANHPPPSSQNEIIQITGQEIVQLCIIGNVQNAMFYSIGTLGYIPHCGTVRSLHKTSG